MKGLGKTQDGIVEMSEIATSSKSGGQSVGKTARVKTVVARVLIGPEEELKRKGFHGNYRSLFFKEDGSPRKNDEYWKGMDGILMASTQYRDRLKYHTRKLSEQFFGLLKADPANLAAGLKFYVDLLSDVRHFNSKSEHSGIKVRSKYLDEFFFGEAFSERSKKKSEGGTPAF